MRANEDELLAAIEDGAQNGGSEFAGNRDMDMGIPTEATDRAACAGGKCQSGY